MFCFKDQLDSVKNSTTKFSFKSLLGQKYNNVEKILFLVLVEYDNKNKNFTYTSKSISEEEIIKLENDYEYLYNVEDIPYFVHKTYHQFPNLEQKVLELKENNA